MSNLPPTISGDLLEGQPTRGLQYDISCGDLILFSRSCTGMAVNQFDLVSATICFGAKVTSQTEYDHIGIVVEDPDDPSGTLYLLEANIGGVTAHNLSDRLSRTSASSIAIRKVIHGDCNDAAHMDRWKRHMWTAAMKKTHLPYNPSFYDMTAALWTSYIHHSRSTISPTSSSHDDKKLNSIESVSSFLFENLLHHFHHHVAKKESSIVSPQQQPQEATTLVKSDNNMSKKFYCSHLVAQMLKEGGIFKRANDKNNERATKHFIPADFSSAAILQDFTNAVDSRRFVLTPDLVIRHPRSATVSAPTTKRRGTLLIQERARGHSCDESQRYRYRLAKGDVLHPFLVQQLLAHRSTLQVDRPSTPIYFCPAQSWTSSNQENNFLDIKSLRGSGARTEGSYKTCCSIESVPVGEKPSGLMDYTIYREMQSLDKKIENINGHRNTSFFMQSTGKIDVTVTSSEPSILTLPATYWESSSPARPLSDLNETQRRQLERFMSLLDRGHDIKQRMPQLKLMFRDIHLDVGEAMACERTWKNYALILVDGEGRIRRGDPNTTSSSSSHTSVSYLDRSAETHESIQFLNPEILMGTSSGTTSFTAQKRGCRLIAIHRLDLIERGLAFTPSDWTAIQQGLRLASKQPLLGDLVDKLSAPAISHVAPHLSWLRSLGAVIQEENSDAVDLAMLFLTDRIISMIHHCDEKSDLSPLAMLSAVLGSNVVAQLQGGGNAATNSTSHEDSSNPKEVPMSLFLAALCTSYYPLWNRYTRGEKNNDNTAGWNDRWRKGSSASTSSKILTLSAASGKAVQNQFHMRPFISQLVSREGFGHLFLVALRNTMFRRLR